MVNVYDLHFKKAIIPLFDYLHNEYSRDMLVQLLTEMPESLDEIYLRQDILKALLQHGLPVFTYKLTSGWSDLKLGQVIFRQEVLDRLLS